MTVEVVYFCELNSSLGEVKLSKSGLCIIFHYSHGKFIPVDVISSQYRHRKLPVDFVSILNVKRHRRA